MFEKLLDDPSKWDTAEHASPDQHSGTIDGYEAQEFSEDDLKDIDVKVQDEHTSRNHQSVNKASSASAAAAKPLDQEAYVQEESAAAPDVYPDVSDDEKPPLSVGSIRGIPGLHFPDYEEIPVSGFECVDKEFFPGFYADMDTGCQVFHVCYQERRESFLCPVGTTFNQAILTCDHWYSSNCSWTPLFYSSNAGIGTSREEFKNTSEFSKVQEDEYKQISNTDEVSSESKLSIADDNHSYQSKSSQNETVSSVSDKEPLSLGFLPPYSQRISPEEYLELFTKFFPVKVKVIVYPESDASKIVAVASVGETKREKYPEVTSTSTKRPPPTKDWHTPTIQTPHPTRPWHPTHPTPTKHWYPTHPTPTKHWYPTHPTPTKHWHPTHPTKHWYPTHPTPTKHSPPTHPTPTKHWYPTHPTQHWYPTHPTKHWYPTHPTKHSYPPTTKRHHPTTHKPHPHTTKKLHLYQKNIGSSVNQDISEAFEIARRILEHVGQMFPQPNGYSSWESYSHPRRYCPCLDKNGNHAWCPCRPLPRWCQCYDIHGHARKCKCRNENRHPRWCPCWTEKSRPGRCQCPADVHHKNSFPGWEHPMIDAILRGTKEVKETDLKDEEVKELKNPCSNADKQTDESHTTDKEGNRRPDFSRGPNLCNPKPLYIEETEDVTQRFYKPLIQLNPRFIVKPYYG